MGFFLFGCGWWLQIEKWWKRKVVGLWLLWFMVVTGGATVEAILLAIEIRAWVFVEFFGFFFFFF